MIKKEAIDSIIEDYKPKDIKIATLCSHCALQVFHGARSEGIKTIGICTPERKKIYDAFALAKPDEYILIDDPKNLLSSGIDDELIGKNAILVPHGSLVEYGGEEIENFKAPILGNRKSLVWERDRIKMFEWMREARIQTPRLLRPEEIDRPCIVKFSGAKGGRGYIAVNSPEEFERKVNKKEGVIIQEYLAGVRFYPHFFYTPLSREGYRAGEGSVELIGIDRRYESNVDEIYRPLSTGMDIKPSFTVVGNEPVVVRESLLNEIFEIGKNVIEAAERLFGGIPGPFCVETVCDENLQFYAFEISSRIVAGTNLYPEGSHYTVYNYPEWMSMGRRIAREIRIAIAKEKLHKIVY
ncbi:MAG: formate--phosphoribosylaminoimidazolecarboxamide ligase [Candidatus Anstonellales archaeon]